jgi:hypothetical protein
LTHQNDFYESALETIYAGHEGPDTGGNPGRLWAALNELPGSRMSFSTIQMIIRPHPHKLPESVYTENRSQKWRNLILAFLSAAHIYSSVLVINCDPYKNMQSEGKNSYIKAY